VSNNKSISLEIWRKAHGCTLRNPNRQKDNPSVNYFVNALGGMTPRATLLWNTYSFTNLPIEVSRLNPFGKTDEEIIWIFARYYKHLAKITKYEIEVFPFVSNFTKDLHFHNIEVWTPKEPGFKFHHQHVLKRIDTAFRKSFPSTQFPRHKIHKPRNKTDQKDFLIRSEHTKPNGGSLFYSRDGHNFVSGLSKVFY
jgi:hypothetical protein